MKLSKRKAEYQEILHDHDIYKALKRLLREVVFYEKCSFMRSGII